MGLSVKPLNIVGQKEEVPTVAFIGRLKKHKLPNHAINAFQIIKNSIPSAKMWVIGDGYMLNRLKKMKSKDVIFFGHVGNTEKYNLLSRAHVLLVPSMREGWGLIVTEANAMGTPVVAYNVNGLRDSVQNGKNGILVNDNTPESLATAALSMLQGNELLKKFSVNALEYSKQFNWDRTVDYFVTQIDKVI
jgi:glycosyltransferase involved in cell wall biosynthesis